MNSSTGVKVLLVTVAILVATIVGFVAGILARMSGTSMPAAAGRGAAAFGVALPVVILVLNNLGLL